MAANLSLAKAFVDISLRGADAAMSQLTRLTGAMKSTIAPLAAAWRPMSDGIVEFTRAASPQAFNTLTGSLQILKATIGQAFIPYIIQASKWIQDLASKIANMDPETKRQIASWIAWVAALGGAAFALSKLIPILEILARNPLALVLTGMAAAAWKLVSATDAMRDSMAKAAEQAERMRKGIYTEKEFAGSTAAAIYNDAEMTDEQKLAKAKELKDKLQREGRGLISEGFGRGAVGATIDKGLGAVGLSNVTEDNARNLERIVKDVAMLDDVIDKLGKKEGVKFTKPEDIAKGKGGAGLAMAAATLGGGSGAGGFTSLENIWSRMASSAVQKDDIQQKLLQLALEGNQIAQKGVNNTERTANAVERMQLP